MAVSDSLTDFVATPRVSQLRLSPDGTRLIATVATLSQDRTTYVKALWEIDPEGHREARCRSFAAKSDTAPAWTPDGSLLFIAKAPDGTAEAAGEGEDRAALWLVLPDGEPRRIGNRPGGYGGVVVAADAGTVVVSAETLPRAESEDDDAQLRKARADLGIKAILHEESPVRYWDHDLGPGELRLQAGAVPADDRAFEARDLTPNPGRALDEQRFAISRDGSTVVAGWSQPDEPGLRRACLVTIDVASGTHRVVAAEPYVSFEEPDISADGRQVVCVRSVDGSYDETPRRTLWLVDVDSGEGRALAADTDLWPTEPVFAPDGRAVFFTSDQSGRHPIFRIDLDSGTVTRVAGDGHYSDVCVSPDGRTLYALRDRVDCPPAPVRIEADGHDQSGSALPAPGAVTVSGSTVEVEATGADGQRIRGWLVLPEGAGPATPAPLLLWVHGGPLGSWNGWSWRWNPWLMTARGYAVLLPDPALSTGYGESMLRRGWGQWGGAPYDDLMAITDVAVARPDIDETRTAAMGASYGGYMANWIAGHTDRFRCIVTHASLWALEGFMGTTDLPAYWMREWGDVEIEPKRYELWSPNRFAGNIRTPMLVIHGDKDYRVPIGEGLALWWDLQRRGVESKFLYFPDENHWILSPGGIHAWYETVHAWLATHVLGEPWERPALV